MKQRLLVVDDEPHILELFERIVDMTPYKITTKNNPLEALDTLKSDRYDLIISDINMPLLNGMELLEKVKEAGRGEEIVMMTAFSTLESAAKAMLLGAFDYIEKPFRREHILFTIEHAMHVQRMRKELRNYSEIFITEPFELAKQFFTVGYIRELAERSGNDLEEMSDRSGLSSEEIELVMQSEEYKNKSGTK